MKRISQEIRDSVYTIYTETHSVPEAGKQTGISPSSVRKILDEDFGITDFRTCSKEEFMVRDAKIRARLEQHCPHDKIAEEFNISNSALIHIITKYNKEKARAVKTMEEGQDEEIYHLLQQRRQLIHKQELALLLKDFSVSQVRELLIRADALYDFSNDTFVKIEKKIFLVRHVIDVCMEFC